VLGGGDCLDIDGDRLEDIFVFVIEGSDTVDDGILVIGG